MRVFVRSETPITATSATAIAACAYFFNMSIFVGCFKNGVIGELFQLLIVTHVPEEDIAIARVFRLGNNFLDGIRRCQ